MFPKIMVPPNHPNINRVFHYFHHPFWGKHPYFWKRPSQLMLFPSPKNGILKMIFYSPRWDILEGIVIRKNIFPQCFFVQVLQQAFSKVGIERHVEAEGLGFNPGDLHLLSGATRVGGRDLFIVGCILSLLDKVDGLKFQLLVDLNL